MMMVNGVGALFGSFTSGIVIEKFFTQADQTKDWPGIWITFASYTLVLAIIFPLIFKYKHNKAETAAIEAMSH
jgi:NHS family xanthosine MFS transporter